MKKLILTVLMVVMLATPCMAEVEPEGMFSIEETKWDFCGIVLATLFPFVGVNCLSWGFYQGKVYICNGSRCSPDSSMGYIDTPVVSIIYSFYQGFGLGVVQPSGIGMFTGFYFVAAKNIPPTFLSMVGIMFKTDDSWTPPTTTTTI